MFSMHISVAPISPKSKRGLFLVQLILGRVAEVATLFDDDGILVRFPFT